MTRLSQPLGSSSPDLPGRGVGCLEGGGPLYPAALGDLGDDAPERLWARGSVELFSVNPRIAIVGTRRTTSYGERVARELAGAFARAGACIVSGLATGIDGIAHRAALDVGGATL